MQLNIDIKDAASQELHQMSKETQAEIKNKVHKWMQRMKAASKDKAPRFTGKLRKSIAYQVESNKHEITGTLKPKAFYGKFIEFPVKRHFVTFKTAPGLKRWFAAHGKKVSTSGVWMKPRTQPFMAPTLKQYEDDIIKDFNGIGNDIQK